MKNSKGAITIETLLWVVLAAAVLVFVIIPVMSKLLNMIGKKSPLSVSNYFGLAKQTLSELKENQKTQAVIYLRKGYTLVGFDYGNYPTYFHCGWTRNGAVVKPKLCGTDACICICDKNGKCDFPYECIKFKDVKNIYFSPSKGFEYNGGKEKQNNLFYLYIQTSCILHAQGFEKAIDFEFEKKKDGGEVNLYVRDVTK
ncbi:MAG: hypothetical protein QW471_03155 [Candidatus Woesearchaeota archaeon]